MRKSNHTQSSEAQRKLEQIINNVKRMDNWREKYKQHYGHPPSTRLYIRKSHAGNH